MTGVTQQRGSLLPRAIAAGTLLGLLGPVVLVLVVTIRMWDYRIPDIRFLLEVVVFLLVCAVPASVCALVGGLAAAFAPKDADWPHFWLFAVVATGWAILSFVALLHVGSPAVVLAITLLAANSWVSGWNAIRVVRTALPGAVSSTAQSPTIDPEMELVARAHFDPSSKSDAVQANPSEVTE